MDEGSRTSDPVLGCVWVTTLMACLVAAILAGGYRLGGVVAACLVGLLLVLLARDRPRGRRAALRFVTLSFMIAAPVLVSAYAPQASSPWIRVFVIATVTGILGMLLDWVLQRHPPRDTPDKTAGAR